VTGFTAAAVHAARDAAGAGRVCFPAGTYSGDLVASVAGQTWRLDPNTTLGGSIQVTGAGVTISGGRSQRGTGDPWSAGVAVGADDVTVEGMRFVRGGIGVATYGRDRTTVRGNEFRGLSGGAFFIWGHGLGADDAVFEGNTVVQTLGSKVSPVAGRGSEGSNPCAIVNRRTIIRNNVIDQGPQGIGWFGIELKCHEDVLIERNTLRGGHALISLPDNNRVTIRQNDLTLGPPARGSLGAYWGVEIANAHDVTVTNNDCRGTTQTFGSCVSMNTAPLRTIVTNNRAFGFVQYLVQGGGGGTVITDNCYAAGTTLQEFPDPSDTVARNVTPCAP
jgi:hypothetical protein